MAEKVEQIDTSSKRIQDKEAKVEENQEAYDLLEDDDDFEEFEQKSNGEPMEEDMQVDEKLWQQDWDDEEADEDFMTQLKQQLKKTG